MTTDSTAPVTVIVPCYNEEAGLPFLLERLRKMRARNAGDWHFLFVDDGSSDGTFGALLRAAQDEGWIEVVRHPENLGLGAALRTGFDHARSPIVCSIDSDCTYPPEKLPELAALVSDGAQIVTASAWHPESADAEGSSIRLWLSRMVSGLYKILIGQDVYTFTCLFRAYQTEAVRRIRFRSSGFAAVAEIMLRAMLSGQRVSEVPMRLESRRFGESKLKVGDAVMAHVRLLLMTAFMVGARQARAVGNRLVG
ncbi:MAG: glycosyltransferase family 2 protein [Deltaproteobacteria bacterium]|nr:glycosyltransferase family 2 protein [Deltaproteobacteria bacterium]